MKTKLAAVLFLLAMAVPAVAQHKWWTLVLAGRSFCGTVNYDRQGNPVAFITDRGLSISFTDYPSLNSKSTLLPNCSRAEIDSALSSDPEAEEDQKKEAEQQKQREKKEVEMALAQYCKRHGDEAGCKE